MSYRFCVVLPIQFTPICGLKLSSVHRQYAVHKIQFTPICGLKLDEYEQCMSGFSIQFTPICGLKYPTPLLMPSPLPDSVHIYMWIEIRKKVYRKERRWDSVHTYMWIEIRLRRYQRLRLD